ncbi:DUF551 domain-containing protein [Cronobacter sakazakii]|uniref:DUF551 domain-containing protein n=1 Tax=Cronobacter sakazakii TaxID=28141 RepID=UPI000DA1A48E|nr:DUF551 domain-containing protein [Cronobacter sakazakii]
MSEISKEALAAACAEKVKQLEFSVKQSAFDSVRHELETELAIARVALLALRERAEPVAWRHDDGPFALGVLTRSKSVAENWAAKGWKITPLYTAPPAPVVPTFDEWMEIRGNKPLGWVKDAMRESYDACRAAMLAAPGKHPLSVDVLAGALRNAPLAPADNQGRQRAPVAAGWIACSERMPEVGDIVLTADNGCVNVGEMERSGANCRYFTSVVSGRELPASHWMPLPEAPGKEG